MRKNSSGIKSPDLLMGWLSRMWLYPCMWLIRKTEITKKQVKNLNFRMRPSEPNKI